jgi:HlyD family secretion protein
VAAAAGLAACSRSPAGERRPTATVQRQRVERIVVATGTIEAEKEVEVRPRISGIVERVLVVQGDVVTEGQALLEIERELLEAQAREARARLEGSRVELRYARIELDRAEPLHRSGTVSTQEYDRARAQYERAVAAVNRDEATVSSLDVQLRYATVTAPIAGEILHVDAKVGSAVAGVTTVTGGTRVLTMAAADALHVKGLVDENDIARVAVGQPARVRTEAHGARTFAGTVREISPLGDRRENVTYFEVEVAIAPEDVAVLRPRMSADADIVTEVVDTALVVPESALAYEGSDVYVERVLGGDPPKTERRRVVIGIVDGGSVQIADGVSAGDEVVLR